MQRLCDAGIKHVFLVTGRGALFLTDALAKSDDLDAICVHHEQSAAFAAIASSVQSSSPESSIGGACLVSTGCASTNTMTGVLSAWQDGVPCIFISGQNILEETSRYTGLPIRSYGQQEADIISMVEPITKYAKMIIEPAQIVSAMEEALHEMNTGRKGPVWIDVPLDIQSARIDLDNIQVPDFSNSVASRDVLDDDVKTVHDALEKAERPTILIGHGIRSAGAENELLDLINHRKIPLTFTASATDIFGSAHDFSIGSVGSMGCSRAGNFAVQNSDLLLVLGSRLNSLTTGPEFEKFARDAKIIIVDIDEQEHLKETIEIDHFIHADVKSFLCALNALSCENTHEDWMTKCQHWKKKFTVIEPEFLSNDCVDLYQLSASLTNLLPNPATLVTDSGLVEVILPTNIQFSKGTNVIHPVSQGAMGFALPAAIGAIISKPQTTIAVTGDGSVMMNLQELETIRHHKLPIKLFVINNNAYSIIRRRQKDLFRKRTVGTDPENGVSCPEFEKVAHCFDMSFVRIENVGELDAKIKDVLDVDGPVLCEIMGREDQTYIEVGYGRSEIDKRFVRRPLEDQKPFLDRELFLSEMIIDPIDQ